jgi:hypothetical protein
VTDDRFRLLVTRNPLGPASTPAQVDWALEQLPAAGIELVRSAGNHADEHVSRLEILDAGSREGSAALARFDLTTPSAPGAFAFAPAPDPSGVLLIAHDPAGFMYGILELRDRIAAGEPLNVVFRAPHARLESPATPVRAIGRAFVSAGHDHSWFRSAGFWDAYLSMLAASRFNQLDLALGMGYNFPLHVADSYFLFAYPFFLEVPGYSVEVSGISADERGENLASLKLASREAARRGIAFHLGLWTHSFENADSPGVNHVVTGVTAENHAAYCRDALTLLLEECPDISGVTFRTHGESGVSEGSASFWGSLFEAIKHVRVPGEFSIDLHAKGLTAETIDLARGSGARVVVSAKFSAEHMGLPYQAAAIREIDRRGKQPVDIEVDELRETAQRLMGQSLASRSATRYSYGDFLRMDRDYDVIYRIWPGTQKVLSWEDPAFALAYAQASRFCGSAGLEIMEPLSFRARRGSGLAGDTSRSGYRDPARLGIAEDWHKYRRTYQVWGDALYGVTPARGITALDGSRRAEESAEAAIQRALATASRVLPLVTTAHMASAANDYYWPEMYTMAPLTREGEEGEANIYRRDNPRPVRFGTIGPLDPVVFSSCQEFAAEWTSRSLSGRYSPLDVAEWLEQLAIATNAEAATARRLEDLAPLERLRLADAEALADLASFFSRAMVAAVGYELFLITRAVAYLDEAIEALENAVQVWKGMSERLAALYIDDLAFGEAREGRGSWADRTAGLERELAALNEARSAAAGGDAGSKAPGSAGGPWPTIPGTRFLPGSDARRWPRPAGRCSARRAAGDAGGLEVELVLEDSASADAVAAARIFYRPVNQFAEYRAAGMSRAPDGSFTAVIPPDALEGPYAIQYFCELEADDGRKARLPGIGPDLTGTPYEIWLP